MKNSFLLALQFLTRIPVNSIKPSQHAQAKSLLYYPLVGLLIGLILFLFTQLLVTVLPNNVMAALTIALWVIITGGLHLDGLADSADAWLGGFGNPEKTLEIMQDPRCGSAAIIAVVLVLLIKFAALQWIISQQLWAVLIIAPMVGRGAIIPLFLWTPYKRPQGLGETMSQYLAAQPAIVVFIGCLLVVAIVTNLVVIAVSAGMFIIIRHLMLKRLGGTTGDTAGALIELLEVSVLVAATLAN